MQTVENPDLFSIEIATTPSGRSAIIASLLGQQTFPTGLIPTNAGQVNGVDVPLGGLSGVTYDRATNRYYGISDDRSQFGPARLYSFSLNPTTLSTTGVTFTGVTPLRDSAGNTFALNTLDPKGIAFSGNGTVFVSSEGEVRPDLGANRVTNPFIKEFSLTTGREVRSLTIPSKFLPRIQDTNGDGVVNAGDTQTAGVRNNLALESLTISPDRQTLYTATENALFQDGAVASTTAGTRSRIIQYNLTSGQPAKEFLYVTDAVAVAPNPTTGFNTNGLVDLLAIDNQGTMLALERSFSVGTTGTGNTIKIYEISLRDASDIREIDSLSTLTPAQLNALKPVQKKLLLNLDDLKLSTGLDNVEGISFGPKLADGRQSIVLVSDNNSSPTQFTQVLTLGLDLATTAVNPFPNGVASGDTTHNSTVLWTHSQSLGAVKFEYSTKADFSVIAGSKTATVTNTQQPVKVEVEGLATGTNYFYRAIDATGATASGTFSTAAAAGTQAGLRFGVSGDWRGEITPYPALANADDRNLKFFVALGDTIYADYPSPAVRNGNGTEKSQATTLADYRSKHNEVYSSRFGQNTLADLRGSTSIFATIDDHEVVNDFQGGQNLTSMTAADRALYGTNSGLVNDSPLYETGLQAFQEYNPIRDRFYGETSDSRTANERKLYRANTYGSDAINIVLDARSFRDPGLAPVTNLNDPTQVGNYLAKSFDPTRTFLGRVQVEDLKKDLLQAHRDGVTWKFVNLPEPVQNIGVFGASDRYEGYAAERTEILKFIDDNKIANVVFIAADIHGTLVNNLTYQLAPGQQQIATSAFEVSTGAVAFDAPFGPTVAQLAGAAGILTPAQLAFYNSLPVANDSDNTANDKDDFIKSIIDGGLAPLGYDPLGLNNNLAQANGLIKAKLLQGDYIATQTFGWTEFDIDPLTQKLTVTTYGIDPYTRAELAANPAIIASRQPRIVSQFEVEANPVVVTEAKLVTAGITVGNNDLIATNGTALDGRSNIIFTGAGQDSVDITPATGFAVGNNRIDTGAGADRIFVSKGDSAFGGSGDDVFEATEGKGGNRMSGNAGNDTFYLGAGDRALGGAGNDKFFAGSGSSNVLVGGAGVDQFWVATGGLPATANTVLDFQIGTDVIGIQGAAGLGITSANLVLTQTGADTAIGFSGRTLAILKGIQASSLNPSNEGQFVLS